MRHDGRGWWVLATRAGTPPDALLAGFVERDGKLLAPLTAAGAAALADEDNARLDAGANRCVEALLSGEDPPPARLTAARTFDGERLRLDVLWDPDVGDAFGKLPGAEDRGRTLPVDPWVVEPLDAFLAKHEVAVDGPGRFTLDRLRAEHDAAMATIRRSRATSDEPIAEVAAVLGGELAPFQWAGVRYALDARRTFIADEQGLGKTVEALAAIEADGAYPGDRRLPGVAEAQLGARDGEVAAAPRREGHRRARRRRRRQARSRSSTTRSSPRTARRSGG